MIKRFFIERGTCVAASATKQRIRWERTPDGLVITMPPLRNWKTVPFLTVWLIGWSLAYPIWWSYAAELISGPDWSPFRVIQVFWLFFWPFVWFAVACMLAGQFVGFERVHVNHRTLRVSSGILVTTRKAAYPMPHIENFQINDMAKHDAGQMDMVDVVERAQGLGGRVLFTHAGKIRSFGLALNPAEGRLVLDLLKKAVPEKFRLERA